MSLKKLTEDLPKSENNQIISSTSNISSLDNDSKRKIASIEKDHNIYYIRHNPKVTKSEVQEGKKNADSNKEESGVW